MKTNQTQKNNLAKWEVKKLSNLFSVKRGGSPRPIEHYITKKEDGLNWLKIGDIQVGAKYITSTSSKILKEGLKKTTLVKPGDFILSNSMSFGRPYISKIETCIHDGWLTFQKIDKNQVNQDFLYYLLLHPNTQNIFLSVSAGSGVQNLKKETVEDISLQFPPLLEQERIVSVLETWDKSIEKLTKKNELKKQIKKGLMQDLLTGRRRLEEFDDKWEIKSLKDLALISKGKQLNIEHMHGGDYPVINGGITESGFTDKKNTNKDTITVSEGGNSCGFVNYITKDFWLGGHCYAIYPLESIDQMFLYFLLKLNELKIMSLRVGSGLPNIQQKALNSIKLSIPKSKEEQSAIAQILTTSDKEINMLENKLKILKEQKRYLLNNLITGAIRTPENLLEKIK